jgi:hypothetical protein
MGKNIKIKVYNKVEFDDDKDPADSEYSLLS